jgi:uncharacterized protein (TIGR02599 family)
MHLFDPLRKPHARAFTLVEVLVSAVILALMVSLLSSAVSAALTSIQRTSAKVDQFAASRAAFGRMTATLSQATLNTYWDYDSPTAPTAFQRVSDLHFLVERGRTGGQAVFFQAPLDRSATNLPAGALNAVGYWVDFGKDDSWRPAHVTAQRSRYRLFQSIQPTHDLSVFEDTNAAWRDGLTNLPAPGFPIADNVLVLVIWPRLPASDDPEGDSLTDDFLYDSRSGTPVQRAQLPPSLDVTMIVIDEKSAVRLENGQLPPEVIESALVGRFGSVSAHQSDLTAVSAALDAAGVGYMIFRAPVVLRESKWSLTP